MNPAERRAGASLAAIFALRMFGLFLILPVFAEYARNSIPGGNNTTYVGLAMGAYGFTQAFLQIPFGMASDRYGRKPVILFGLALFVVGSIVAALATDIYAVIAGRALQGAGAISAAVTALAADLTRDQHRTKIMAMIGSSIGLVFALSMVAAPLLLNAVGMSGIFWLIAVLAFGAMALTVWAVPPVPTTPALRTASPEKGISVDGGVFRQILCHGSLMRLNFGIFALHLIQMMMWVTVPTALTTQGGLPVIEHWKIYLPAVLLAIAIMVPAIIAAERGGRFKLVYTGAVTLLALVQFGLHTAAGNVWLTASWLTLFFISFNILEAMQPSLISRIVSPEIKGAALGVYNTLQSVGVFLGGVIGGWINHRFGETAVGWCCGAIALAWLVLSAAYPLSPPPKKESSNYQT
ncbi:MAG: MFS transporter [Betaproteobacteria bacterium]|nr:MFS transporter [Betaproteobacteria bacterium]